VARDWLSLQKADVFARPPAVRELLVENKPFRAGNKHYLRLVAIPFRRGGWAHQTLGMLLTRRGMERARRVRSASDFVANIIRALGRRGGWGNHGRS